MEGADPLAVLRLGADSYAPLVGADGELRDPVFGEPTQYGTPYHAFCRAVLAAHRPATGDLPAAVAGLSAALAHVADRGQAPRASSFQRAVGTTGAGNHRDFFWPPILRGYGLLCGLDPGAARGLQERIAAVDPEAAFAARPPSNWAAVWLSGEWLRMRAGLARTSPERFDRWLGAFFEGRILLEQGLYQEPGHPNSYDLFTRLHLADLLADGYAGAWRPQLERLMETGLERSLAVQLSDGGLAAAHRSSGQSWNDGAQCCYFQLAARHFRERDPARSAIAQRAAGRALRSLQRWQRPGAPFSPVYNCLPPDWRVGYEPYTADAHYGSLALAFLAAAVLRGLGPAPADGEEQAPQASVEGEPTWRAVARAGRYAVQVNGLPAPHYDGFGLTEVTFGPGRRFHFGPSARQLGEEGLLNLGLAVRAAPGRSALRVLAREPWQVCALEAPAEPGSLRLLARGRGDPCRYALAVRAAPDGVAVEERLVGHPGWATLLVPYLLDGGTGCRTVVEIGAQRVRFQYGEECIRLEWEGECEAVLQLTHGYESRRGLCGLLRLDLGQPADGVRYRLAVES